MKYILDYPDELHTKAKMRAVRDGITLKDLIIRALTEHLARKQRVRLIRDGKERKILVKHLGRRKTIKCGQDDDKAREVAKDIEKKIALGEYSMEPEPNPVHSYPPEMTLEEIYRWEHAKRQRPPLKKS